MENILKQLQYYFASIRIDLKMFQAYDPQSNGIAESLAQEDWARARELLVASNLLEKLWA